MKNFLTLLLTFTFILSSNAQRNYSQELVNLLQQDKAFEAREFREQYADKLPSNDRALNVFYKAHMDLFFNKPDSAAIYIKDLLANYEYKLGPMIGVTYGKLLNIYNSKQHYRDGMALCNKYMDCLRRNPFDRDSDFIRHEMAFIENEKKTLGYRDVNEPRIKIERDNSGKDKTVRINDSEYIRFNARYNGVTVETWFDTGVSAYFTLTRSLADKLGTKLVNKSQDSVQMLNGVPTKMRVEVIEHIDLGDITLHNIPVLVLNERFTSRLSDTLSAKVRSNVEREFNDAQVIMGLPAMRLIGRIDFDWEKRTVSFPASTGKIGSEDSSNLFLAGDNLFLKLKINGLNWVGQLDVGSNDFLIMGPSFYNENRRVIEIDTVTPKKPYHYHTLTGSSFNIPHEFVKNATIYLKGRRIDYANGEVLVLDKKSHFNIFDGVAGVRLFKRLGPKITFDFDNMCLKATD